MPVIDEVVDIYRRVHGSDLISVYLSGSMVRGGMQNGSDADFCAITSHAMKEGDREKREALFDQEQEKYRRFGLGYIDGISIPINETETEKRRKALCAIQIDGVLVWGTQQDFSFTLPKTRAEFVELFLGFYPDACTDTSRLWLHSEYERVQRRRGFAKAQIRTLFGITALQRGADYTATISQMIDPILRLAPEVVDLPRKLYDAYLLEAMPDDMARDLERTGLEILELGQRQGFFAED